MAHIQDVPASVTQALDQLTSLVNGASDSTRSYLADQLRNLSRKLETPTDTLYRVGHSALELPMIRFAEDLKLFNILAESKTPLSVKDLATKTGCAEILLGRSLRFLAAYGAVQETGQDLFTASNITKTLALPGGAGMVYHLFDSLGPAQFAFPEFAKQNKYRDLVDNASCPFQKGHNTELSAFGWIMSHPELANHFNNFMSINHMGQPSWLDKYPLDQRLTDARTDQVLMVDVGGGLGHQLVALQKKLDGKVPGGGLVLQDLPQVISMVPDLPGITKMPQDIFSPQQVKGAKIYYFRNVLHDWPDHKAIEILRNTASAMGPGSVVLIDEICAPNTGVHWQIASLDMMLMVGAAARERTRDEWVKLIGEAGFVIRGIHTYTEHTSESVIEVVPV